MLALNYIRNNVADIKNTLQDLNMEAPIDDIIQQDTRRREILAEVEDLRAERNKGSKAIGQLYKQGQADEAEKQKAQVTEKCGSTRSTKLKLKLKLKPTCLSCKGTEVCVGPCQSCLDSNTMIGANGEHVPVGHPLMTTITGTWCRHILLWSEVFINR